MAYSYWIVEGDDRQKINDVPHTGCYIETDNLNSALVYSTSHKPKIEDGECLFELGPCCGILVRQRSKMKAPREHMKYLHNITWSDTEIGRLYKQKLLEHMIERCWELRNDYDSHLGSMQSILKHL